MRYRSRFNATGGIADFWSEWKKPTPYRWPILFASLLMTSLVLGWLTQETYYYPPEQPKVTYITTFADGRTDEDIRASNLANQQLKDEREAEEQRRLELRRDLYKQVGAASGLDVEAMEAEIRAEEAAEAEAERERLEELFGSSGEAQTDSE